MNYFTLTPNIKPFIIIVFACVFSAILFEPVNANTTLQKLEKHAVENKDIEAQYLLGYRYEMGKGVKRNHNKAISWYKKAALRKHRDAQYRIGVLYYKKEKYVKARYWLAKRAKHGHADSQYYFANTFRYALGTKEQTSIARKWYTKAANQDHAKAQYELGLQFQKGIGAKKSQKLAKKWLNRSAKNGNKKAELFLARHSSYRGKKPSAKQILKENIRLARNGNTKAQYTLGKFYLTEKKSNSDLKKSFYWLKKAANKKHANAQYELGLIYLNGNTAVNKNLGDAKKWLTKASNQTHRKANIELKNLAKITKKKQKENQFDRLIDQAMLGNVAIQYNLGMRYLFGYQIEIDNLQAIYWLRKAALQNHALAQYQLANQYMTGTFVNQDTERSIHFFVAAAKQNIEPAKFALEQFSKNGFDNLVKAEQGEKNAQYLLALTYLNKKQTIKQKQGIQWLQSAAEQSHPLALLKLGNLYKSGKLISRNNLKAFGAYSKAAELNNPEAQFQLSLMYKKGLGTNSNQSLAFRWLSKAASQGNEKAQKSLQLSEI